MATQLILSERKINFMHPITAMESLFIRAHDQLFTNWFRFFGPQAFFNAIEADPFFRWSFSNVQSEDETEMQHYERYLSYASRKMKKAALKIHPDKTKDVTGDKMKIVFEFFEYIRGEKGPFGFPGEAVKAARLGILDEGFKSAYFVDNYEQIAEMISAVEIINQSSVPTSSQMQNNTRGQIKAGAISSFGSVWRAIGFSGSHCLAIEPSIPSSPSVHQFGSSTSSSTNHSAPSLAESIGLARFSRKRANTKRGACFHCGKMDHQASYCKLGGSVSGIKKGMAVFGKVEIRGSGGKCFCCASYSGHSAINCPYRNPLSFEKEGLCYNCGMSDKHSADKCPFAPYVPPEGTKVVPRRERIVIGGYARKIPEDRRINWVDGEGTSQGLSVSRAEARIIGHGNNNGAIQGFPQLSYR